MPQPEETICTITREDLARICGGRTNAEWAQMAKARVGSAERCAFLEEDLKRQGVDTKGLTVPPPMTRGYRFNRADLTNRHAREFAFSRCNAPATGETSE